MKVDFVWIENYKSFNGKNKIKVEPTTTTVIGKNESGKSNLIDILGSISLQHGLTDEIYKLTPQAVDDAKLSVEIETTFSSEDLDFLNMNDIHTKSRFHVINEYNPFKVKISGGIKEYFENNEFTEHIENINEIITLKLNAINNPGISNNLKKYEKYLKNASNFIIGNYSTHLSKIKQSLKNVLTDEEAQSIDKSIDFVREYFSKIYNMLPIFHKYHEHHLLNQYQINEKFLDVKSHNLNTLKKFLKAANCNIEDLKKACLTNPHGGKGMDAKRKIENGIEENIVKGFNNFYKQEKEVHIEVHPTSKLFSIFIRTNLGPSIAISERSEGLKWYLNLYIDILANNLMEKNVVYLIDEPGTRLHVDAQKKVLELFDDFTSGENQIVYTTHSPFMINENRMDQIRVIQKNNQGNSKVFSSVLSDDLGGNSKSESLSPLVNALGMKIKHNIGMSDITMNVITEGHSDVIFLGAMAQKLSIKGVKFIPSKGASQIINIAKILWGWGFPYKILLDSDKAGEEAKKIILKEFGFDMEDEEEQRYVDNKIIMISDIPSLKINDATIESLVAEEDYKKIDENLSIAKVQKDESLKILFSKSFVDALNKNQLDLNSETINNFEELFVRLK